MIRHLLRCMSPEVALPGPWNIARRRLLMAEERTGDHSLSTTAHDPEAGISPAEIPQRNSLPASRAAWPLTAEAQQPANLPTIGFFRGQWVAAFGQRQSTTTRADTCLSRVFCALPSFA